jgi:predicted nicotinamide N-methyase
MLARRLSSLGAYLPPGELRVLELGAGTGLVGIAAACIWKTQVHLTDLPEIVPNLQHNADQNSELVQRFGGALSVLALDWSDVANAPRFKSQQYSVILAADPLYSAEHPKLLAETIGRWLRRTPDARFIVELPLREGYSEERANLKTRLEAVGLQIEAEGVDSGYDDWEGCDGQLEEVTCWWAVWKFIVDPA